MNSNTSVHCTPHWTTLHTDSCRSVPQLWLSSELSDYLTFILCN